MVKKYYIKSSASALKSEIDRIRDQLAYLEATRQEIKTRQPNAEVPTRSQTAEAVREQNTGSRQPNEVILREPNGRRSRRKTAVFSTPVELETKVVTLNLDEPETIKGS